MTADVVVIGAGAIGASAALHLARAGAQVILLEKEREPALHQSGRNSGVIHAGYNLKPGSNKARYCVEGSRRLREYCREHGIPMFQGGILIVARSEPEAPVLEELKRRADQNGVQATIVHEHQIRALEPHARGFQALHAPEGASFDAAAYVRHLIVDGRAEGIDARFGARARSISDPSIDGTRGSEIRVETSQGPLHCRALVNCAGLHADQLAGQTARDVRVVPFRGYYAELIPERTLLIRSHVYAAPDLTFPWLGVHISRQADGRVLIGPGAMIAFGREAYRLHHFNLRDLAGTLSWPGFYRMITQPRVRSLIREEVKKSLSLSAIWQDARLLIPDLRRVDLKRSLAGNRAQLIYRDGRFVDDILVRETEHAVHVLNAVSPGLTGSLPFGEYLAGRCLAKLDQ